MLIVEFEMDGFQFVKGEDLCATNLWKELYRNEILFLPRQYKQCNLHEREGFRTENY